MDISVDRKVSEEGHLVFTITAKNPHKAPFGDLELNVLEYLDKCRENFTENDEINNKLIQDVMGLLHAAKEKAFLRLRRNLTFAIDNQLNAKIEPMRQEIYNWIYDMQEKPVKTWMQEFDPQRTKFYFDNDKNNEYCRDPSTIADDKLDDDEEDDE
jgi:hypothetical protein